MMQLWQEACEKRNLRWNSADFCFGAGFAEWFFSLFVGLDRRRIWTDTKKALCLNFMRRFLRLLADRAILAFWYLAGFLNLMCEPSLWICEKRGVFGQIWRQRDALCSAQIWRAACSLDSNFTFCGLFLTRLSARKRKFSLHNRDPYGVNLAAINLSDCKNKRALLLGLNLAALRVAPT